MKIRNCLPIIISVLCLWSCSDDETEEQPSSDVGTVEDTGGDLPQADLDVVEPDEHEVDQDTVEADLDATPDNDADAEDMGGPTHGLPRGPFTHPRLLAQPEDRERVLALVDTEPWSTMVERIREEASREYREEADPAIWDHSAHGTNAGTAAANAMLAWLFEDEEAANKAADFLSRMTTHFETNDYWDVNIRMPGPLMGYSNAVDLLMGTPWFTAEQAEDAAERITTIAGKFYDEYIDDDMMRILTLSFTQNNHPIRTAAAIGYVALAFPDHPDADEWADWAVSELDYLLGPTGHYIQADGGVSEGPFYYSFGFGAAMAFALAWDTAIEGERVFDRDCRNRTNDEPWSDHGCVPGERFPFDGYLHDPTFISAAEWSIAIRLPSGMRPSFADSGLSTLGGVALFTAVTGEGFFRWDWEQNEDRPSRLDLTMQHLVRLTDEIEPEPPSWLTRFFPEGGNAVFRSGWDYEARWLLLMAENGPARMTVHDHVDGTSFMMAAYGEYLLIDTGYYKPEQTDNAVTANAPSHSLLLIEGSTGPPKGLLTNFGDTDAFLLNTHDGLLLDYAEAHQDYQDTHVERSVVFVRDRYFVVADHLTTTHEEPREHAWRLHGWAGFDSGGFFELQEGTARWERERAGVDFYLASTDDGLNLVEPPHTEHEPPHVNKLDSVHDHAVVDGVVNSIAPAYLAILAPYKVGVDAEDEAAPLDVQALDLGEGVAAWLVAGSWGTDLVLLRQNDAIETFVLDPEVNITTDGRLIVVALAEGDDLALLVRGSDLTIDDTTRATAGEEEPFVVVE